MLKNVIHLSSISFVLCVNIDVLPELVFVSGFDLFVVLAVVPKIGMYSAVRRELDFVP